MPDEPNKNLDEQLSAWARKRRDEAGAPYELHPATRKLLQDEVARTFQKKPAEPAAEPAGWWRMFWPRFALAGGLCLALVAVVGLLIPSLSNSKSNGQQIALVRRQEMDLSSDSERRDTPAQTAPNGSVRLAVESPVPHLGDEAGKSAVAESQPPAVPSLAENKPSEQEVRLTAALKDVRLKAGQPATVEDRSLSEKSRQVILSDKAKEPAPAGTAAPTRELYAENERDLLRQRYALAPAQAGGVMSATNALANPQKAPAAAQTPPIFASLGDLKLESGQVIRDCRIAYRTFGQLNADKSNAVLFTTWFTGTTADLIESFGPGKLVDTSKYYGLRVFAGLVFMASPWAGFLAGAGRSLDWVADFCKSGYDRSASAHSRGQTVGS